MGFSKWIPKGLPGGPPSGGGGGSAFREIREANAERQRQEEEKRREEERQLSLSRERELKELTTVEEDLRKQLVTRTQDLGRSIDQDILALNREVGFRAGEATQEVAAQESGRGLLRSSFGARRFGKIQQANIEQQAGLEALKERRYYAASENARKALDEIAQKRQELATEIQSSTRQALDSLNAELRFNGIKSDFEQQLNQLQIDAAERQAMINNVAGIFQGITTILVGSTNSESTDRQQQKTPETDPYAYNYDPSLERRNLA